MWLKNIVFLFLLVTSISFCQSERQLVWEDNFDGDFLNTEVWSFELGDGCPNLCGWGNNELQIYTQNNHELKDGLLTITAKHKNGVYSSSKINTQGNQEFQYGKIEVKAKLPKGKGLFLYSIER